MSEDYHHQHSIFSNFSNGQLQIQRGPPPLVGVEEEQEPPGTLPVYQAAAAAGVLSEMFNFTSGAAAAAELLETQIANSYRRAAPPPPNSSADWLSHSQGVVVGGDDSAAEPMQLFPHPSSSSSAAFHGGGGAQGQFTWPLPNGGNRNEGLSLSLSSSLQQMEAAKAEELYFAQGGGVGGYSYGVGNLLRNSKYSRAAQELLEEFCSVGRGHLKKNKFGKQDNNDGDTSGGGAAAGGWNSPSSSKDPPPLSASDRLEHQRRKVKLLSMLDEVERRYNHYCEQMQMVVNSFDMAMGYGAAAPYTSLAQKAMSRHFRCLKDAVAAQLKHSYELLGEKDAAAAAASGVTKGETPRLRMLEQSLRQQRAFQQTGMMEQEAWRPQRGLPERSVNILRAWLFEHFLHPYPSDADKHLLARQTGLSRNQVSNWFINARVRLWKPMVEEMYQKEAKEETAEQQDQSGGSASPAQTPTLPGGGAALTPPPAASGKRPENDPSFVTINSHHHDTALAAAAQSFPAAMHETNTCRGHPINADVESSMIRFGTSGDVSLTLGLRHAGNMAPEKSAFSVRDFGGF